jgi:hypothetical protein
VAAQPVGEVGEVLPERDLVPRLLVRQPGLRVAELVDGSSRRDGRTRKPSRISRRGRS